MDRKPVDIAPQLRLAAPALLFFLSLHPNMSVGEQFQRTVIGPPNMEMPPTLPNHLQAERSDTSERS